MEIKEWTYEEFPEYIEVLEGVPVLDTTGMRCLYTGRNIEYGNEGGTALHLEIITPVTRNN